MLIFSTKFLLHKKLQHVYYSFNLHAIFTEDASLLLELNVTIQIFLFIFKLKISKTKFSILL